MSENVTIDGNTAAMTGLLEAVGAADIDIVPLVFDRFFAAFPEARALFYNLEAAAGRMVNETLEAMIGLAESAWWVETTVLSFVDLHLNYGEIPKAQYDGWIDVTVDVLIDAAGADENSAGAVEWRKQAVRLKTLTAAQLG